jgi:carboxyl-terminal processing protease
MSGTVLARGGVAAGHLGRTVLGGIGSLLVASACATRGLPPLPQEGVPTMVSLETLRRTQELSLYPERLDRRFLVGALDALEARFDSVRFEDRGPTGVLRVGEFAAEVPLAPEFDVRTYMATLARAVGFVAVHLDEEIEPDETLELIALRGGLFAIDKYATILSGRSTEDFKINYSGHLKGIGSTIGRKDGMLEAVKVFPDSPAERGGLRNGDKILTIDGEQTQPLSVSDAVDRIRGEADTVVVLGVEREKQPLELRITRGEVIVPSVEAEGLEDGIGYAKINQVSRSTDKEFQDKVEGLGPVRGLVLDLRGNSGGAMSGAQQLADFFLSEQLIVRVVGRGGIEPPGGNTRLIADPGVQFRVPVAVLVDPFTASAAEILSGALEPLAGVTLIGQKTYGKGVIQQVLPLPQENLLKLTVAQYLLSADRVVDEVGIAPDVAFAPISPKQLGALASVPRGSIPYVRTEEEEEKDEDRFPVEAAELLLRLPADEGLAEIRKRASARIAEVLAVHGVNWREPDASLPDVLPQPLEVSGGHAPLTAGQAGTLRVQVHNPNPFPLDDVWIALEGTRPVFPAHGPHPPHETDDDPIPPAYLSNKLLALGSIAARGTAEGAIELTPPEGVTALDHPIGISVASGSRPLHSERLVLQVVPQPPDVRLAIQRTGQRIYVDVTNRGASAIAEISVDVGGANNLLKELAPGETRRAELQLSGDAKELVAMLAGPWARRRISLPIPEAALEVAPPRVQITRDRARGTARVHVEAQDGGGLREGWLVLDDQKQAYVAWGGSPQGELSTAYDTGMDHRLAVKVESSSGVSVIEALELSSPQLSRAQ